jgi:LmbE family N-acetylglucosaminyl deacetylase
VPEAEPIERTGPVLGIFAHPDDAEISAGGTMAKWSAAGREVHLLVLTNGDRGSNDRSRDRAELAATRLTETEAGAEVMGLASTRSLGIPDGELANGVVVGEAVVRRIREVRAQTVVSVDPTAWFFQNRYYNHSDHRTAGEIALDAVYPGSGNPHYFSEHLQQGLDVCDVYDIWLGWTNEANHIEDISGFFDTKIAALAKHDSQLTEGIRFFEEFLGKEAIELGEKIGASHGEDFRVLDLS